MTAPQPTQSTEIREFSRTLPVPLEIRAAGKGGDGRIVEGIVVPFDTPVRIDEDLVEEFASGCCDHQMRAINRIRFKRQHWSLIGSCVELRNDAAGLFGAFRVARTALGDDTLALIEAGALTDLSVGFRARQDQIITKDGETVTRRVTVDLREVSSVEEGAYQEHAVVTGTRARIDERTGLVIIDGLAIGQPAAAAEVAEAIEDATRSADEDAAEVADEPAGTPNLDRARAMLARLNTRLAA